MSQVDEILKRLDKDSGSDVVQDDCQTHGLSNHLSLANQGGYDCTHACIPCVVELNEALAAEARGEGSEPRPNRPAPDFLAAVAAEINRRYPRLDARAVPGPPGERGVLVTVSEVQTVFIYKIDRWRGQVEDFSSGWHRAYAFDFEIKTQPPSGRPASVAEYLASAVGRHMITHGDYRVGERVQLAYDAERFPGFIAPAGLLGTISVLDEEGGAVSVLMDEPIPGCEEWNNHVIWEGEDFYRFALDVYRPDEPTGERRFVHMLSCGEQPHSYGPPEVTDHTWVDNGAFRGYSVGLQRVCTACGYVSSTSNGIAPEELPRYRRAKYLIRFNGTKVRIKWGNAAGQQRDPRAEEAQAYADNYQITVTYRLDPTGRDDEEMREEFADELRASFHSGSLIGHISEFIEIRRDEEAVYADVIIDRCMSDDLERALDNYPCVELEEALKLQLDGELRECAEAGRIHAPYEVKEIDLTQLSFSDVRLY